MPVDDATLTGNRLLASLPEDLRAAVAGRADVREYGFKDVIYEPGRPVEQVLFPLNGVFSLLTMMEDGRGVEVATVGNEGFIGLPVFLQATFTSALLAIAQIPGRAVCLEPAAFLVLANRGGPFQTALQRYAQALITQIAQGSACNRLHAVEQRCTRWLLQTHDRVGTDEFELTQEFLGRMLGVGRPAVNAAAQTLQDAGLIRYTRGRITILDRPGLESLACECYAVIRDEFDRLLKPA
jgi:CRP-like cAMP-binding protein